MVRFPFELVEGLKIVEDQEDEAEEQAAQPPNGTSG